MDLCTIIFNEMEEFVLAYLDNDSLPISSAFGEIFAQRVFTAALSLGERLILN